MRRFNSQTAREAHPVSVHEVDFPELCVDMDNRSLWVPVRAGTGAASWRRLSGPLQELTGLLSSAGLAIAGGDGSGYVAEGEVMYVYGNLDLDGRLMVDGRLMFLPSLDAPKTVLRSIGAGQTITIAENEQLVMLGPLTLNGRLVCNGNLAFA